MNKVNYPKRLSVSITRDMDHKLTALAMQRTRVDKPVAKADIAREALRLYLEGQRDAQTARAQLTKTLEARIDQVLQGQTAQETQLKELLALIEKVHTAINTRLDRLIENIRKIIDRSTLK